MHTPKESGQMPFRCWSLVFAWSMNGMDQARKPLKKNGAPPTGNQQNTATRDPTNNLKNKGQGPARRRRGRWEGQPGEEEKDGDGEATPKPSMSGSASLQATRRLCQSKTRQTNAGSLRASLLATTVVSQGKPGSGSRILASSLEQTARASVRERPAGRTQRRTERVGAVRVRCLFFQSTCLCETRVEGLVS